MENQYQEEDMDLEEIEEDIIVDDPMSQDEDDLENKEDEIFEMSVSAGCAEEDKFDYYVG